MLFTADSKSCFLVIEQAVSLKIKFLRSLDSQSCWGSKILGYSKWYLLFRFSDQNFIGTSHLSLRTSCRTRLWFHHPDNNI